MITPAAWGVSLFLLVFWLPLPSVVPFLILALTGSTLLFSKISDANRTRTVVTILVLLFVLGSILTIVLSKDLQRSISTSLHQEMGVLLFFIIAYGFKGKKDFILTFIALSVISAAITIYLLGIAVLHLEMEPLKWAKIASLPIILVPNDISFPCLLAPFFFCLCSNYRKKSLWFVFLLHLTLLIVTAVVYRSAVGLLCLAMSIIGYSVLTKNWKFLYSLGLICITAVLADLVLNMPLSHKFILAWKQGGWDPRFALWLVALGMFLNAPLTGYGPHTFINYYNDSVARLDLPSHLIIDERIVPWAHNLYLEILAERGIFVFLIFIALIILPMIYSGKALKGVNNNDRYLVAGIIAAMWGFCVGAFFEFSFLRIWVVVFFYAIISWMVTCGVLQSNQRKERGDAE